MKISPRRRWHNLNLDQEERERVRDDLSEEPDFKSRCRSSDWMAALRWKLENHFVTRASSHTHAEQVDDSRWRFTCHSGARLVSIVISVMMSEQRELQRREEKWDYDFERLWVHLSSRVAIKNGDVGTGVYFFYVERKRTRRQQRVRKLFLT